MTLDAQTLKDRYGALEARENRADLAFAVFPADRIRDVLTRLRLNEGYVHLSFHTAVDLIEQDVLELLWMVHNPAEGHSLGVKARLDRKAPSMESLHDLWEALATYQRELREMFGVDFPGCPRLHDDFALEGWDGPPPMRRDFDTRAYSEETYFPRPGRSTSDPAEHRREKLYPGRADL